MCTSDPRSRTACSKIRLTTLTIGAFASTATSGPVDSVCRTRSSVRCANSFSAPLISAWFRYARSIAYATSAGGATNSRTGACSSAMSFGLQLARRGDRRSRPRSGRRPCAAAAPERAGVLFGQQPDDRDVGPGARDVDRFETDLLGERRAEHTFGDDAELDEDLAEALAARRLRAERVAELLARQVAPLDEQTRRAASSAHRSAPARHRDRRECRVDVRPDIGGPRRARRSSRATSRISSSASPTGIASRGHRRSEACRNCPMQCPPRRVTRP